MPAGVAEVTGMSASRGRTLLLVENLSVPFDRRVWQESAALHEAGYDVTVVSPKGTRQDRSSHEICDGISIHRYALRAATGGPAGYVREYGTAIWHIARLVRRLSADARFDVIHAANPPDVLLIAALPTKRRGTRFIFDHHDLVPELYLSRFGRGRDALYRGTLLVERVAFHLADVVIATNESYRRIALERGGKDPNDVFVVRSAPDLRRFHPVGADAALKRGRKHLIVYLGVMGPQDGVDHALRALRKLQDRRRDWYAVFIGEGDVFPTMRALAHDLGLAQDIQFTGRIPDDDVMRILSTADVCLAPDPQNPLNDASTMNKIVEYMAMSRPVVSYDLAEARESAGESALYARPNDSKSFAHCIEALLDDPARRRKMGQIGRRRVEDKLSWERSKTELLRAYERVMA